MDTLNFAIIEALGGGAIYNSLVNFSFGGRVGRRDVTAQITAIPAPQQAGGRLAVRAGDDPHSESDRSLRRRQLPDVHQVKLQVVLERTLNWMRSAIGPTIGLFVTAPFSTSIS